MSPGFQGKSQQSSIAKKTLLNLAVRIAIVIIVMTAITYYHVTRVITNQNLEQLAKYVAERGQSSSVTFELAADNHAVLKKEIINRIGKNQPESLTSLFNKQMVRFEDGSTRTPLEDFDGTRQAGAFIAKNVTIDDDLKRRMLLFIELSNQYGEAWHHRLQNIYFTTPENTIVVYWPEYSSWAHELEADYDMSGEEWVRIANKDNNPLRESVWTGLFYEKISSTWMVSIETPVDYRGRHIATIGHDIPLNDLIDRTLGESLEGSYNIIFRQDGRLIAHPAKTEELKKEQGTYDINKSDSRNLKTIYQKVTSAGKDSTIIENQENDEYLVFTRMNETDWYFVTVYPKSLVQATAFSTARLILILGVLSLVVELAIFFLVLRKYITRPLQDLMSAVRSIAKGNYGIQLNDSRDDEIGRISKSFNDMVVKVQQRSDELKESESYKNLLYETTPVGLALSNMDGKLVDINPAYANIIGRGMEETKNLSYWDITPKEYDEAELEELEKLAKKGHYGPFEKEYLHLDGHRVPVRLYGRIITIKGENYIWSSIEDITQQKEAERQLKNINEELEKRVTLRTIEYQQAKEVAERANRAKSKFLSSMSHELRTPLNAILGFGQILQINNELSPDDKEQVNDIVKAGEHLLGLINEVLDLARIEAGHIELSIEPINYNLLMNECINLIEPITQKYEIELVYKPAKENVTIRADRTRMKQVIVNLLSNAIKYNKKSGRVDVGIESLNNEFYSISVKDSGVGIKKENLNGLFEPFNRLDAEYSEVEGTGIGLVITKQLVEMMGGNIRVKSEYGKGSIFQIEIPKAEAAEVVIAKEETEIAATAAVESSNKYNVLYIEDNPVNIKLVENLFTRRTNIKMSTAHTPTLGLELAEINKPDLILLDIQLPEMDGYKVLDILKTNKKTSEISIVGVSANAMPADIIKAEKAGFDGYLTKPLDITLFYETIDSFLPVDN